MKLINEFKDELVTEEKSYHYQSLTLNVKKSEEFIKL